MKLSSSGDGYFIPDVTFNEQIFNTFDNKVEMNVLTKKKPDHPPVDSDDEDNIIYSNSCHNSPNLVNKLIYKMDTANAVKDESK